MFGVWLWLLEYLSLCSNPAHRGKKSINSVLTSQNIRLIFLPKCFEMKTEPEKRKHSKEEEGSWRIETGLLKLSVVSRSNDGKTSVYSTDSGHW